MTDVFDQAEDPIGADSKVPRDQWGRYKLPHPLTGTVAGRTRVTTFAKSISDTYVLNQWSQRMAAKGLTMRPDLFNLVAATPLDDRETLNRAVEDAKEAASAKAAANMGTAMHAFAQRLDERAPGLAPADVPDWPRWPEAVRRDLAARDQALIDHRITMVPSMIERIVYVPEFDVAGTFDRWGYVGADANDVREYGDPAGEPGEIIDDKTGRDLTYGQTEIAIQLACYANATHVWNFATSSWETMPPTRRDRAIVIHMPIGQGAVTIYEVDIAEGWEAARLCAEVRAWRKRRNLFTTLAITEPQKRLRKAEADLATVVATEAPDDVVSDAIRAVESAEVSVITERDARMHQTLDRLAKRRERQDAPLAATGGAEKLAADAAMPGLAAMTQESASIATPPAEPAQTRPPTWAEQIAAASSRGDLSRIWRAAAARGEWTKDLEALGRAQMSKWNAPATSN